MPAIKPDTLDRHLATIDPTAKKKRTPWLSALGLGGGAATAGVGAAGLAADKALDYHPGVLKGFEEAYKHLQESTTPAQAIARYGTFGSHLNDQAYGHDSALDVMRNMRTPGHWLHDVAMFASKHAPGIPADSRDALTKEWKYMGDHYTSFAAGPVQSFKTLIKEMPTGEGHWQPEHTKAVQDALVRARLDNYDQFPQGQGVAPLHVISRDPHGWATNTLQGTNFGNLPVNQQEALVEKTLSYPETAEAANVLNNATNWGTVQNRADHYMPLVRSLAAPGEIAHSLGKAAPYLIGGGALAAAAGGYGLYRHFKNKKKEQTNS